MNTNRLKEQKILTLKLSYKVETKGQQKRIVEYIKNYNSVFNCLFNFLQKENPKASTKETFKFIKTLNNIWVDTYFQNGALYDTRSLLNKVGEKKTIFGGKNLFFQRMKGLISKEEFRLRRMRPLQVVGAACEKGNKKFQILSETEILFKPTRQEHFILKLQGVGKNYQKYLKALILCQEAKEIPITYKLGSDFVSLTFNNSAVAPKIKNFKPYQKISNRILAVDLNPNFIGWSVVDWKNKTECKVVASGLISTKPLQDKENRLEGNPSDSPERKKLNNKRKNETIENAYFLTRLVKHYRCEIFAVEDLSIKRKDSGKGRKFNKLIHSQWQKNLLVRILEKLCLYNEIKLLKVSPDYSSFQGNLVYREEKLPDPCLSSIEIGRRGYEFYHQYVLKDTPQQKNIIFDKIENVKTRISQSLEELGFSETWETLSDLYYKIKKARWSYRFPLEQALVAWEGRFFSRKHRKALKEVYFFG